MPKFDDSTIARNLAIAAEYFKAYYTVAYKKTKFSGGTTGFIPFNIEFTIDGLSGIKIYNKLRIDTSFLPNGYPLTLDFIVTGIEHKLKDGDWETVIKTTLIPKLETTEVVVTSANFKYIPYKDPVKITPVVVINSNTLSGGPGLEPLKKLIAGKESFGGDYAIYNYGESGGVGIKSSTPGSVKYSTSAYKLTDLTVREVIKLQRSPGGGEGDLFAVGKYQTVPTTLIGVTKAIGIIDAKFDAITQEKIGDQLLLGTRPPLGNYLKGNNSGDEAQLSAAVQSLGMEFASFPIIKIANGTIYGNVVAGTGNKTYYGGQGPNKDTTTLSVGDVVKLLIKCRIQYSSKQPSFIPSYYNL
jgi:hypothetical protein